MAASFLQDYRTRLQLMLQESVPGSVAPHNMLIQRGDDLNWKLRQTTTRRESRTNSAIAWLISYQVEFVLSSSQVGDQELAISQLDNVLIDTITYFEERTINFRADSQAVGDVGPGYISSSMTIDGTRRSVNEAHYLSFPITINHRQQINRLG